MGGPLLFLFKANKAITDSVYRSLKHKKRQAEQPMRRLSEFWLSCSYINCLKIDIIFFLCFCI